MFAVQPDDKPTSIILTTLAARTYPAEPTLSAAALYSILNRMDADIDYDTGIAWIANPADPAENFADRWQEHPERKKDFERVVSSSKWRRECDGSWRLFRDAATDNRE